MWLGDSTTIFSSIHHVTTLRKKTILLSLKALNIGRIASRHCKPDEFNLQNMVDSVFRDVIDNRLHDYCVRTKAGGGQTKKHNKTKKKEIGEHSLHGIP